jgi:hypothetical protein
VNQQLDQRQVNLAEPDAILHWVLMMPTSTLEKNTEVKQQDSEENWNDAVLLYFGCAFFRTGHYAAVTDFELRAEALALPRNSHRAMLRRRDLRS